MKSTHYWETVPHVGPDKNVFGSESTLTKTQGKVRMITMITNGFKTVTKFAKTQMVCSKILQKVLFSFSVVRSANA